MTFSDPQRNSGKPSGDSERGSRTLPMPSTVGMECYMGIIRWKKEYIKDLLNPTDMLSLEEVELENSEEVSPISRAEIIKVTKYLWW